MKNLTPNLLRCALAGVLSIASAAGQIAWRTDFDAAHAEATRTKKLILVAVSEPGEAGSEATRNQVWSNARFAGALRDVLPVMVCVGSGDFTADLPGVPLDQIRRDSLAAFRTLFGPGASIVTPQILVISPEIGVLWHHQREADLRRVVRGLDTARQDSKRRGASQLSWLRRRVAAHAAKAATDELEYQQLNALVRNANIAHLDMIFEVLAKDARLTERLLGAWFPAQSRERARDLVVTLEKNRACRVFATLARQCEMAALERNPDAATRDVSGPLAEVRAVQSLDRVRFLDGKARSLASLSGKPTVLLFLLPGSATLAQELAALRPVIRELDGLGVQCLALFGSIDMGADQASVKQLDLPCPAGLYPFNRGAPFFGVAYFPGVLVLDELGRVVLADDGPNTRSYTAFAPTARGLARYLAQRPVLADAVTPSRR